MPYPNALIFVDYPSTDPEASAEFYEAVFARELEPRPSNVFHRIVPGQNFRVDDGSQGPTGNLHMGIHNVANARPHPEPAGVGPRRLADEGRAARVRIMVSDDDSVDRIIDEATSRGGRTALARPLLDRIQWLQRRDQGPVGQHVRPVDQGRRRPPDPRRLDERVRTHR